MPRRMLTFWQKFAILEEAEQTGSIKITAHKHKSQKTQRMNWSANKEKLVEKREVSRDAQMIHKNPVLLNQ